MKKHVPSFEDFVNEGKINHPAVEKGAIELAHSMANHTKPDKDGNFSDEQIEKAMNKYNPALSQAAKHGMKDEIIARVQEILKESVNESTVDPRVKKEAISRLSDFFRVPANALSGFNFDGKDNIKALTKALNSTSDQGTELYYKTAIKLAKEEVGVDESVNESTINRFQPVDLDKKSEIDLKLFSKLMPRTSKTVDSATSHIWTWEGSTMFVHYQYFIVKPHGNKPDRPTYRIHNSQYWLNDAQLTWQGRKGESVNVTLLTIYDITDPNNEKNLGAVYVNTDAYLDEQPRVFEIIRKA